MESRDGEVLGKEEKTRFNVFSCGLDVGTAPTRVEIDALS